MLCIVTFWPTTTAEPITFGHKLFVKCHQLPSECVCVCTQTEKLHPQFLLVAFFPDVIISSSLPSGHVYLLCFAHRNVGQIRNHELTSDLHYLILLLVALEVLEWLRNFWAEISFLACFMIKKSFLTTKFNLVNWNKISLSVSKRENWKI